MRTTSCILLPVWTIWNCGSTTMSDGTRECGLRYGVPLLFSWKYTDKITVFCKVQFIQEKYSCLLLMGKKMFYVKTVSIVQCSLRLPVEYSCSTTSLICERWHKHSSEDYFYNSYVIFCNTFIASVALTFLSRLV